MSKPTPTTNETLPFRVVGFETLSEGLDYAAKGETGCNFYSVRGELQSRLTYAELRDRAISVAERLIKAGVPRGARMAIIGETSPDFLTLFFACQYAGVLPVPLPIPMNLGGKDAYVQRLQRMVQSAGAAAAVASPELLGHLEQAVAGLGVALTGTPQDFYDLPAGGVLRPFAKDDLCYIQYSSGSTRMPHGVAISQRSATSNCRAITLNGLEIRAGDRCTSWLPFYHDMGLVGFCFTPILTQMSVDYMATPDFARRPFLWLNVLSQNGGTLSFSPTFGYDLCVRRAANGSATTFDLSSWRVAGIGGDMIRADTLNRFAETFAASGFRRSAFVPSYGLAESTLAVTFAPLQEEFAVDRVDKQVYSLGHRAVPPKQNGATPEIDVRSFVICGRPMPGHEVEIRNEAGVPLPERAIGKVYIKGPSVMDGYFRDELATARVLSSDGWLDTGDMGYRLDGSLVITGRSKDLIICNGRNIWPQDVEWAAEQLDGLRHGDVAAFAADGPNGEIVVVVAQCRLTEDGARRRLQRDIAATVRSTVGVDCEVVLAPHRSLPHTSSGKLSRTWAKANYDLGLYSAPSASPVAAREAATPSCSAAK